ncbi:MAG: helix-turn-helix domain-containing protein [Micromonosporaceae bacterium]|nr:helix-turn-helix domain-containing protein [Micromonosporaceae bacterium]
MHQDPDKPRRIDDLDVLKGLAQPLRQRLWRLLHQLGPCTVGTLAARVGADPGQVSYHLRELAKRGWIEPAPELARDRRESWWRAVPETTTWTTEDFPTPEARAVVTQLNAQLIVGDLERLRQFMRTEPQWSPEWLAGSGRSRSFLFLTAAEAQAMHDELNQVLRRWAATGNRAREAGQVAGRRPYLCLMFGFPEPGGQ